MTLRGHKNPGPMAKILFGLIVVVSVLTIWFVIRAYNKMPDAIPVKGQSLPAQAALRAGALPSTPPNVVETPR